MVTAIPLKDIEEEQKADRETVEQISKIIRFLWNIEDWTFITADKLQKYPGEDSCGLLKKNQN